MMKPLLTSIACLVMTHAPFAQQMNTFEKPTNDHVLVKGTNIALIPPQGFLASERFKGFARPGDPSAMIMAIEIKGPFGEVSKGFEGKMLASKGITLHKKDTVRLGPYTGYLMSVEQAGNGVLFAKTLLAYGDQSGSYLVNGMCPKDSTGIVAAISASIRSAVLDQSVVADPRAALDYQIDETAGGLVFHSVLGSGALFTRDGETPTESQDKANLVVDQSYNEAEITDRRGFCRKRLAQYPEAYTLDATQGLAPVAIGGLEGYALHATSQARPDEKMYQVILFGQDGGYYILVGSYAKEAPKALSDLQTVIQTFTLKH